MEKLLTSNVDSEFNKYLENLQEFVEIQPKGISLVGSTNSASRVSQINKIYIENDFSSSAST